MRRPQMSGHCAYPQTEDPDASHRRCTGGNTANPDNEFQPCPCRCHFPTETYDCECGGVLVEVESWPEADDPDEPTYLHLSGDGKRVMGEYC